MVQAPEHNDKPITLTPEVKDNVIVKTTTSPIKKKAVHLLDIENEDRGTVLNNEQPAQSTQFSRMVKQVPVQKLETGPQGQPIMLRNILK